MADPGPHDLVRAFTERKAGRGQAAPEGAQPNMHDDDPQLTVFEGYLGDQVTDKDGITWQQFYFDATLNKGMLVENDAIEVRNRRADRTAAFGERDTIWVRIDGSVGIRNGPTRLWLSGPFTRAGDFAASMGGGTMTPAGGVLLESTTPTCCGIKSH